MTEPRRLLDLFCGAGGCSVGYHRAGFDITGVDIDPRGMITPYPFPLIVDDALSFLSEPSRLRDYHVIHASPPCQGFTTMSNRYPLAQAKWPKLIAPVRKALRRWGGTYVIENVVGARSHMHNPIVLSGAQFGLQVHRPRLFESNVALVAPPAAGRGDKLIGVYGDRPDGRRLNTRADGSEQRAASSLAEAHRAMGIDWMDWSDLTEAIPPAYTEYIGRQLLDALEAA